VDTATGLARICRRLRLPLPRYDHSLQHGKFLVEDTQKRRAGRFDGHPRNDSGPDRSLVAVGAQSLSSKNGMGKDGNRLGCAYE